MASADNCLASGGGGLILVGGDLERTGRAFEGGFAGGGGEADEDSTDTAGGGVLWDFGASTTNGLGTGGAIGVAWLGEPPAPEAAAEADLLALTPAQWLSIVVAPRVVPWDLQLLMHP